MKAKFLTMTQKLQLIQKLESGDKESVIFVMDEIARLENIVYDYEQSIVIAVEKFKDKHFKKPKS